MNLRPLSFLLVALLGTAGCVSVPAEAERSAPAVSARPGNAPAAQASPAPTEPPAVHDALGASDDEGDRADGKNPKKKDGKVRAPAPVGQEARNQPRRVAPALPGAPRRAPAHRRAEPRQTYDMRTVCATGRGVASADILALCRTTYGR